MEAYIIKGYRTAVGKAKKGGFRNYRSDDLAVHVIKYLMKNVPEINSDQVDDVIVGCANPEGEQGLQIGRLISARALGNQVAGITINRYCASGLEAIAQAVSKIKAGFGNIYIAGGTESMSAIPMTGYKLAPSYQANIENINYHVSMGHTAEAVAKKFNISRDAADEFSFNSHLKASSAIDSGAFKEQIVPISIEEVYVENDKRKTKTHVVDTDEGVRRDTSVEGLSKLRAVFKKGGVVTAGNASQTSDGAAFTLIVSESIVKELKLEPIARLVSCAVGGVDPLYMGIGPCVAIPKALKQAGLDLSEIEQTELNEAFAAQALAVTRALNLADDDQRVNPNGGAIALGHPLGMSGARLALTAVRELQLRRERYALCTMCIGVGQGIAVLIERV